VLERQREKNVEPMKRTKTSDVAASNQDDLRPEYDFDYRTARSNRFASRVDRQRIVVALDPDVSKVFTTPESVNAALRALIEVVPRAGRRS
jgi:hypothetical protein